jgi:cytochrome c oxidase assembly factor CtaG
VLVVTVSPPVHWLADEELALHMVQHLVLVLAVAPLLSLAGVGVWRWALLPGSPWAAMAWAVVAHGAAMWLWHAPAPFDAAVDAPILHVVEHAFLVVTGVWFWSAVVVAVRADLPAVAVAGIFAVTVEGMGLGALMALAARPWYEGYSLADQQLAGVIMWCPAGFAYLAAAAALLLRWLAAQDRRSAAGASEAAATGAPPDFSSIDVAIRGQSTKSR